MVVMLGLSSPVLQCITRRVNVRAASRQLPRVLTIYFVASHGPSQCHRLMAACCRRTPLGRHWVRASSEQPEHEHEQQ